MFIRFDKTHELANITDRQTDRHTDRQTPHDGIGRAYTIISATTVDTFKARLDRFWQNQEVIYNWKTDIHIGNRS